MSGEWDTEKDEALAQFADEAAHLRGKVAALEAKLQDIAVASVPNVNPRLCEKKIEDAGCPDSDTTLGCRHEGGHRIEVCATHDEEWSECSFRPFTDRILALQKRMASRAIYTFTRRVDQEWLDPSKGVHYGAHPDGTPYAYDVPDGVHPVTKDESPPGLYPVIVVPKDLIGEVVAVRRIGFREGERL